MVEKFDKITEFEAEIEPLILELRERCKKHGIPMLINCLPYDDENTTNSRTSAYFGEEGGMKDRQAVMQIGLMSEVAGLPYQMQMLLIMMVRKFKDDFKDQLKDAITPAKPGERPAPKAERHPKHGEEPDNPMSDQEEAMIAEVLRQLGVEGKSEGDGENK